MKFIAVILMLCITMRAFAGIDENEVYCYMKGIGIKNADIVLRQAIFESGHFKSAICKKKNNIFGFRSAVIYKSFKSWQDCVDYYKKWQDKHYKDTTEEYYHFLQRINYSGLKNYNYPKQLQQIKIQAPLKCKEDEPGQQALKQQDPK